MHKGRGAMEGACVRTWGGGCIYCGSCFIPGQAIQSSDFYIHNKMLIKLHPMLAAMLNEMGYTDMFLVNHKGSFK